MITSIANLQVKELLQLQKKSKVRNERGIFVVEGDVYKRQAVGYQPTLQTEMGALQERITSTKNGSITSVDRKSVV